MPASTAVIPVTNDFLVPYYGLYYCCILFSLSITFLFTWIDAVEDEELDPRLLMPKADPVMRGLLGTDFSF